jgi:hypothetical protein
MLIGRRLGVPRQKQLYSLNLTGLIIALLDGKSRACPCRQKRHVLDYRIAPTGFISLATRSRTSQCLTLVQPLLRVPAPRLLVYANKRKSVLHGPAAYVSSYINSSLRREVCYNQHTLHPPARLEFISLEEIQSSQPKPLIGKVRIHM